MIYRRTMVATVIAGICIVSGFAMYDAGLLGVHHIVTSGGGHVKTWDTERGTKLSVMVFEGHVKSVEVKHVYEPPETISVEEHEKMIKISSDIHMNITGEPLPNPFPDLYPVLPNGDLLTEPEKHVPHNYVTVQVTEWFKDSTGQYADQVVFQDSVAGAVGKIGGKPAWFENPQAIEYSDNEKAIFFVEDIEGVLATDGATQVFRYDKNGMVYLQYFADLEEPRVADELRADIRGNS